MTEHQKVREKSAIRAEIDQWKLELAMHMDECPICDEEAGAFCPRVKVIQHILVGLGLEMLVAWGRQAEAEGKSRKQRRLEKKRRAAAGA